MLDSLGEAPQAPRATGPAYIVAQGFFAKGELAAMCRRYLESGPLTTRELAERVMTEKGLDASDGPLRNSVMYMVVQAPQHPARRGGAGWQARRH